MSRSTRKSFDELTFEATQAGVNNAIIESAHTLMNANMENAAKIALNQAIKALGKSNIDHIAAFTESNFKTLDMFTKKFNELTAAIDKYNEMNGTKLALQVNDCTFKLVRGRNRNS